MATIYDRIHALCDVQGINDAELSKRVGIYQSFISDLKTGRKQHPSAKNMSKIADYFNVSVQYLMNGTDDAAVETDAMLNAIKENEDMRALFMCAKDAKPEDIRQAIKIIEALKNG